MSAPVPVTGATLPAREYLDEAAKAAGWPRGWFGIPVTIPGVRGPVIAHARTLEERAALAARLAEYEPPVDLVTAEVRECIAQYYEQADDLATSGEARAGGYDTGRTAAILRIRISREKEHPL